MTATAAKSSVRYAMDRWNRRIGAGRESAAAAACAGADAVWAVTGSGSAGAAVTEQSAVTAQTEAAAAAAGPSPAPMRLFHLSIAYLTLLFAAVAVTALLPWGRW